MAINVNTQVFDEKLDRSAMIRLYEKRLSNKVDLEINGHRVRVDKLIRDAKFSNRGFFRLRTALASESNKTAAEAFKISKRSLLDLASDELNHAYVTTERAIGKLWRTAKANPSVAEEIVLRRTLAGDKALSPAWKGIAKTETRRIEQVIRRGIAEGMSTNQIARIVRKSTKITRNNSRALVTTSVTSVVAQADREVYKANEKAIEGWQYVAVLDSRTSFICSGRDGNIYDVDDVIHLPPAHYNCRSTTTPVFKAWADLATLDNVSQIRKRNLGSLSRKEQNFYDGKTALKEPYNIWLTRQSPDVQLKHLGEYQKVELFRKGQLSAKEFKGVGGANIGINQLRKLTDSSFTANTDTKRFAVAKEKLDAMRIGAARPEDLLNDVKMTNTLRDYYLLQSKDLDGILSTTNYRGNLIGTKRSQKRRVLQSPPREDQLIFNPITSRYEDTRMFTPNPSVLNNNLRLVKESVLLKLKDKEYIEKFSNSLAQKMSVNERAVVVDNLRILFTRYRRDGESWVNFKAVSQSQIKFDVMNISDSLETQLRKDSDVLKKLLNGNYIDPVLGPVMLKDLQAKFIDNIVSKNNWEVRTAPKIAKELRDTFDFNIPLIIRSRLADNELDQFYERFARRLALADTPDRDQLAVQLGRDLYNSANLNGSRNQWYRLGVKLLDSNNNLYEIETFGVQKRRMKSRNSGQYFGPYYDTLSYNIRITDPRIQAYSKLTRAVDLGLRIPVTEERNRLIFRAGFKTYFAKNKLGLQFDTGIPITSTSSFRNFPTSLIDDNMADALNWTAKSQYTIDEDFYDFIQKLLYFEDDRGKAKFYNGINEYKKYIAARGDAYERFKTMEYLRKENLAFSNNPFVDHRARIYDRGLIGPQSGETFRPFLNTIAEKEISISGWNNFNDQVGSFLGGLDDFFEGRLDSLTIRGRQKISEKWRKDLIEIGDQMRRGKPRDIRAILESPIVSRIEGEEMGKFFRFAIEYSKINEWSGGDFSDIKRISKYRTRLALEQDASSSGAQIIALTTKNKQLAELSNVIPTQQKNRLYDVIAAETFSDPRFKRLNEKLGLTEKDLRKAAKAQNMVTFYGAGERTGVLNVEGKLSKVLGKDVNTLVVRASDREVVLSEISARIARYDKFDQDTADELRALRKNVKDVFNKGIDPGDDILEQLFFLDNATKELVENLSKAYDRVVTPQDFRLIAQIMSENLASRTPILKDFTKFFGRLAEDFLINSKPSSSSWDWKQVGKTIVLGKRQKKIILPKIISRALGIKDGSDITEEILKKFNFYNPDSSIADIIYGVEDSLSRRTGGRIFKIDFIKQAKLGTEIRVLESTANTLPKDWTNVPWVNFDGKIIEQNFTQRFEERLIYKTKDGEWVNNVLQVPQKSEAAWWEILWNDSGNINDIADATKARTAFAVNGNHSNDATFVKQFHLWGKENKVPTSTIHDAFFTNIADMQIGRNALRKIFAKSLNTNVIKAVLNEMRSRGLPKRLYDQYLEEAIEIGLIPVAGKSRVGGKLLKQEDILDKEAVLEEVFDDFKSDKAWYGVG